MFFPEFLLRLSQRDEQVTWLDPLLSITRDNGAAAAFSEVLVTVPDGRALFVQSLAGFMDPGAAQAVQNASFRLNPPAGSTTQQVFVRFEQFPATANVNEEINWAGSILVPSNWQVLFVVNFDAGVAVNALEASIIGLLIPISNIQRV